MDLTFEHALTKLNTHDETHEIEAKRGSAVGASILETVSAFSNEPAGGGGYLLLGVEAQEEGLFGPIYGVSGLENADQVASDLVSMCAGAMQPPVRPEVETYTDPKSGKRALIAFIPEADRAAKPVIIRSKGLEHGAYRRSASSDVKCQKEDLAALFNSRIGESYDATVVHGAEIADIDTQAIQEFRQKRAAVNPDAPELTWSDPDLLRAVRAVAKVNGEWVPTITGIICFGTEFALRRYFPLARVDYITVEGTEWVPDAAERFTSKQYRLPLITLLPKLIATVVSDVPMIVRFGATDRREEVPLIPRVAVREALVNAVMHRNYTVASPVQVIRYSDRLEIRNPGYSLAPEHQFGEPGSWSRNENVAAVLNDAAFAENKGSGIRAMIRAAEQAGIVPPTFESSRSRDQFVATFRLSHFLNEEDFAWLKKFDRLHLSEEDAKALVLVRRVGRVSNAEYRSLNSVDTLTASRRLRGLVELGLLLPEGRGAATVYLAGERLHRPEKLNVETEHARRPRTTSRFRLDEVPPDLIERSKRLGATTPATEMRELIRDLLHAAGPMTVSDIASVIPRHPATIRGLLWHMVDDGSVRTEAEERFVHNRLFAAVDDPER